MVWDKKCYCCGINKPISPTNYYCKPCLMKLAELFASNDAGILHQSHHADHCISCGEWEHRRILYTGRTKSFSSHPGDGVPICSKCVETELQMNYL